MIDKESPLPLYYQIKQLLAERIRGGDLRPGDMLPTDKQVQEEYGVSRTTARQAFRALELDGLVSRYRGRGTFVAQPKATHSPQSRFSLSYYLVQQGMQPGWRIIAADWVPAPPEVAVRLRIEVTTTIYCLQRLRLADDEPIGYHVAYLSPAFNDAIDDTQQAEGGSLQYLRTSGRLEGSRADRILEAVPAGEAESTLLGVERGAPLLLIRRLLLSATGSPIEDTRAAYRGDRFQYYIPHQTETVPMTG